MDCSCCKAFFLKLLGRFQRCKKIWVMFFFFENQGFKLILRFFTSFPNCFVFCRLFYVVVSCFLCFSFSFCSRLRSFVCGCILSASCLGFFKLVLSSYVFSLLTALSEILVFYWLVQVAVGDLGCFTLY